MCSLNINGNMMQRWELIDPLRKLWTVLYERDLSSPQLFLRIPFILSLKQQVAFANERSNRKREHNPTEVVSNVPVIHTPAAVLFEGIPAV